MRKHHTQKNASIYVPPKVRIKSKKGIRTRLFEKRREVKYIVFNKKKQDKKEEKNTHGRDLSRNDEN